MITFWEPVEDARALVVSLIFMDLGSHLNAPLLRLSLAISDFF